MGYPRLAERIYNTPLLIAAEKAEVIESVFRAHLDGTAKDLPKFESVARPDILTQTAMTFTRQRAGYMRSDNGVAMIQVIGSLAQRTSGLDAMSGMESYTNIAAQLQAALSDPMVRGILLEIDSPGGEANGVAGLAAEIRAADALKPVVAHANEIAFSAAYWLAASAGELYVPKTGMVGSVGVIMLHVDQSRMNEKRGLEVTHITAGARKADFSPHNPLSDTALNNAQAMVDRLYGQFVDDVAQARGIESDAVRATEAGLLDPDQAMANGMIDGIATMDVALQRLSVLMGDVTKRKNYGRAAADAQIAQEHDMDPKQTAAAASSAAITPEQLAAAEAKSFDAGKASGLAEAKTAADMAATDAGKAASARIKAITEGTAGKDHPALAKKLAFDTTMSAVDAESVMAGVPKEVSGNALDAALRGLNPKVGADGDRPDGQPVQINTAEIYRLRAVQSAGK